MRKDVLFRGCTRPAMFMGVPYLPFFLGAGGALMVAMWFGLQYLILIPVVASLNLLASLKSNSVCQTRSRSCTRTCRW